MAAVPSNSKETGIRDRAAELRRMRLFATGLLLLMFALFVASTLGVERWPQLAFVRAFAEAAMVGAIADWFAVVALFRRPFGLPIPHTAIIPRNKDRIGQSLGSFICNNFLAPDILAAKLDSLDLAGRLAHWLTQPASAGFLSRRAAALVPPLLEALEEEHVRRFVRSTMRRGLESLEAAPLASRVLSVAMAQGHHQVLFDRGIELAEDFLLRHEQSLRETVSARTSRWIPRWVDEKLADKLIVGILDTLAEMRDPAHPWRGEFHQAAEDMVRRLAHDPDLIARAEALKAEIMANPAVEEYLDNLWLEIKTRLRADVSADEGVLRLGLERALLALGHRLAEDARMQSILNRWIRKALERYVVPHRGEIGDFISGVVSRWDTRTVTDKLELQVGKDLQYIRINGTLVGGLVGLLIYALSRGLAP